MCDTDPDPSPTPRTDPSAVGRRSLLTAALAGTGLAVAGSATPAGAADALTIGSPRTPSLPVLPAQPRGTALTLLGTSGGPQAEYVRTGTSSALTVDGVNYLVDAGRSSVTQYLNSGLRFSRLGGIFLTHLHADHLADYYNYFLLEGGQPNAEGDRLNLEPGIQPPPPLRVYGPGPAGALPPQPTPPVPTLEPGDPTPGIQELTARMNAAYAYSYNLFMRGDGTALITDLQDVREIRIPPGVGASPENTAPRMDPFIVHEDSRVRVSAVLVPHGHVFPAFAYRFETDGGSVVFSGDTSAPGFTADTNNVIRLAGGADVLVHEVIDWDFILAAAKLRHEDTTSPFFTHLRTSHTTTEEVARVATAAGVPQLVLTHLIPSNPLLVPDLVWRAKVAAGYAGRIHVGNDLDRLPVTRRGAR